jgi:hypothetical protein
MTMHARTIWAAAFAFVAVALIFGATVQMEREPVRQQDNAQR